MRLFIISLILGAFASLPSSAQTTWVVDAFGSGDFLSIQEGLAAASDGDIVRVLPGTYDESPTVSNNITLVGEPSAKPVITGLLGVNSPSGAILGGLNPWGLHILQAQEPVLLADMEIGALFAPGATPCTALRVTACSDVRVERSLIFGARNDGLCDQPGLLVENATVTLVQSVVLGGSGVTQGSLALDGLPGALLRANSTAYFADTNLRGGFGAAVLLSSVGDGGDALVIEAGSRAFVRGAYYPITDGTRIEGGLGGADLAGGNFGEPGFALSGDGDVVVSGVLLDPPATPPSLNVVVPAQPEPFAQLSGDLWIGGQVFFDLTGPPGASFLLFLSFAPDTATLPGKVEGPIGIDFTPPVVLLRARTLFGSSGAQTANSLALYQIPNLPSLEGLLVVLQPFVTDASVSATWFAVNPLHMTLF